VAALFRGAFEVASWSWVTDSLDISVDALWLVCACCRSQDCIFQQQRRLKVVLFFTS